MRKWSGALCILLGVVLIGAAALLLVRNRQEDRQAQQESDAMLEQVRSEIAQPAADPEPQAPEEAVEDNFQYAGILSIPDLSLELPVIDGWSYSRLKLAPCRQQGSAATYDLVIAAHNYKSHFGTLKELTPGAAVTFTDMDGAVYSYTVQDVHQVETDAPDEVFSGEYDLVLYTCTYGGKARVAAFCLLDSPDDQMDQIDMIE